MACSLLPRFREYLRVGNVAGMQRLVLGMDHDDLRIVRQDHCFPDCGCSPVVMVGLRPEQYLRCKHNKGDGNVILAPLCVQETVLELWSPDLYGSRGKPPQPLKPASQEERVEAIFQNVERGFDPFHPDDWMLRQRSEAAAYSEESECLDQEND